jgi:hypothetical protein
MNFPIHMTDLDAFVADLRKEGFDARSDIFNGQIGLVVGPGGLDPARMPPNISALFLPLWEINSVPNRARIEARQFQEIIEKRPTGWQLNRPQGDQPERTRINLPHWNRSASLLGGKTLEESVQQELIRRYPPNAVPVHIDVVGGQDQTYATVFVTNADLGINLQGKAIPEDYLGRGTPAIPPKMMAILEIAQNIISELQAKGLIPTSQGRTTYPGLQLSLRAIGRVGNGPDMTKWTDVYQYVVENLPPGEQAWIANFGAPYRQNWKILRATGNVQSDWRGDHQSAEEALAVIEVELSGGSALPIS